MNIYITIQAESGETLLETKRKTIDTAIQTLGDFDRHNTELY